MKEWNKIFTIVLIGVVLTTSTGCSAKESKLAQDVMNTVKDKARNFAKDKWQDIEDWATEDDGIKLEEVDPNAYIAYEEAQNLLKHFKMRNMEGIKDQFCSYIKEKHEDELSVDIEACLSLIDGKIISYDEPVVQRDSWETDEDGFPEVANAEVWYEDVFDKIINS